MYAHLLVTRMSEEHLEGETAVFVCNNVKSVTSRSGLIKNSLFRIGSELLGFI